MLKRIIIILTVMCWTVFAGAQQPTTPAVQLAHHIADKMKDSLGLSNQQRAKVFAINMELYKQKTEARNRSKDRQVIGKDLQRIESGRDSLYRSILSGDQYTLYRQKKRSLVSSN